MTKFKVYRVQPTGFVTVEIVEAYDWSDVANAVMYQGYGSVFKIEVFDGPTPVLGIV